MIKESDQYNLKILKRFSQDFSTFKPFDRFDIDTKDNLNRKITFKVYLETTRYDEQYYNIVFGNDANTKATCDYIKKHHKDDLLNENIGHIIFLFKDKRSTDQTIDTVNKILKPKKAYYIENLIKKIGEQQLGEVFDNVDFISPNVFTFPKITLQKGKEEKEFENFKDFNTTFLNEWFDSSDSSILVLKGDGGIGKTTIAKYLGNHFIHDKPNSSKIFIDSLEAKNRLLNNKDTTIDLYELYVASTNGSKILDRELFIDNLDAGNFFLIIDGIDELISKVDNFNIEQFLDSISEFTSVIKGTKIIITCRTYFWDFEDSEKYGIRSIMISPFTKAQTEDFFNRSFEHEKTKVNEAMKIAIDFHKTNDDEYFHPYALDIIYNIIDSEKEIIKKNEREVSQLLNPDETKDYIIDRICFRENFLKDKKRILDLTVDEQLGFFKELSVKYNGILDIDNLKKVVTHAVSNDREKSIPNTLIEALKTHPLIIIKDNIFRFRYDFFVDFFKSIYLSNFLDYKFGQETITQDFVELLRNCWFGSSLADEVSKRVNRWSDAEFLKIDDLVDQIAKDESIKNKKEVFSGIFNVVFYINKKKKGHSSTHNTELVSHIFEKNGQIENLYLINVFNNKYKIKFNFSGKVLRNCHFENYSDFWDCSFDAEVYFTNCKMLQLGEKNNKKEIPFNIRENVDKNCIHDKSFADTFIKGGATDEEFKKDIEIFCKNFVKFFYTRGTLWKRNYDTFDKLPPLSMKFDSFGKINLKFDELITLLDDNEFITFSEIAGHQKIAIAGKYRSEIVKYIEEGSHSQILNRLSEIIYKRTRN